MWRLAKRLPSFNVRFGSSVGTSAHARPYRWRVTIIFGRGVDRAKVEETVLHELCHFAAPHETTSDGREAHHGDAFNWLLLDVAKRLWGTEFDVGPGVARGGYGPSRWLLKRRRKMLGTTTADDKLAARLL